jgi:nitrite reductase (NADH) small subunit
LSLDGQLASPAAGPPKRAVWTKICPLEELPVERGVTALVHGQAVAVFRTHDDRVYALGNHDPFSKASVLARGIVGTRGDVPFVASPMHKHPFDLRTGQCLDDDSVRVPVYDVQVVDGVVQVGPRATP